MIYATRLIDADLIKYQKKLLKFCAFCEFGIRSGVKTPKFLELSKKAAEELTNIEDEFFRRHPEEIERRNQAFLRACEFLIDCHNAEEFGTDKEASGIEYFTEYNVPKIGMKRVTCRKTFLDESGEPTQQTTESELKMKPYDLFFAELENAMDEYAETLPDVSEET